MLMIVDNLSMIFFSMKLRVKCFFFGIGFTCSYHTKGVFDIEVNTKWFEEQCNRLFRDNCMPS